MDQGTGPSPDSYLSALEGDRLDATERALCLLLALGSAGRYGELETLCLEALRQGVELSLLREGALMIHLFAGFPRAIEAFHALDRAAGGMPPAGPDRAVAAGERPENGDLLFGRIYGRSADSVRDVLRGLAPEFERAVLEDAYGRILSRPGLDARTRELMAVCALTTLGLPRQLRSHMGGALNCGATPAEVREVLELTRVATTPERADGALAEFDLLLGQKRRTQR